MGVVFDAALAWKRANIKELRRSVIESLDRAIRDLYDAIRDPEQHSKIVEKAKTVVEDAKDVEKRVPEYTAELNELDSFVGTDPGKAWDIVKKNIEDQIKDDEALLRITSTGPAIRRLEAEILTLRGLLAALVAEGRP